MILGSGFKLNSGLSSHVFHSKSDEIFKGTLQDLRINERFLPFFEDSFLNVDKIVLFRTRKLSERNLLAVCFFYFSIKNFILQGTISDDICTERSPCQNNAVCHNTFNDFVCKCIYGWIGLNCAEKDYCNDERICPQGSVCVNTNGGFVCKFFFIFKYKIFKVLQSQLLLLKVLLNILFNCLRKFLIRVFQNKPI